MKILDWLRNGKGFYLFDGVLIASIIFFIVFPRPSLLDYERRCRETADPKEKEKIALAAVDFLLHEEIPDSIAHQVNQEVVNEDLSLPVNTLLFPEISAITNDSLAGLYDGLLTENLPKLYWMRRHQPDRVRSENFSAARKIAAQVDARLNYSYWLPLMDFLEKADAETWHRWRTAAKAAELSRTAYNQSQFGRAKFFAVYGFHSLVTIPDRRLYLDLCFRLQNAIAEGPESLFNIGFALADWVARESRHTGYFLRVVSMEFNCGNQLFQLGRYDEALGKFKNVALFTGQWQYFPRQHMQWYSTEVLERSAAVLRELGDYSGMRNYLDQYGKLAKNTRQKTLHHNNLGMAAWLIGDFQVAEKELQLAIVCGKGDEKKKVEADQLNLWLAYLMLGDLYLKYHLPEKALLYFQSAKAYFANDENFLKGERLSDYWLYLAEVFVQKHDMPSAEKALGEAKKQMIDSPVLRVKSFFSAAQIHENLGQRQEAATMLAQAREICQNYGMTIYEIDAILQQAALSFKAPKDSSPSKYPAEELENLLARVSKIGGRQQLVQSLSLAVEAASRAGRYDQARLYANWLWQETESLSRRYDQEQRLIFFQHSIYDNVKAAINLDLRLGQIDSAFIKLDYVKSRALRWRMISRQASKAPTAYLPHADPKKLQKQLRLNEALIDYMVAEDTLYVFALTPSALQVFRMAINRRGLQALVMEYLAQLNTDDGKKSHDGGQRQQQAFLKTIQLSHALYNKLIRSMAGLLEKIDRLYVVPDEFLHLLPFNSLALQEGLAPKFLIEHKAIMYLPAASYLFADTADADSSSLSQTGLLASIDPAMHGATRISECLTDLQNMQVTLKTRWENQTEIAACARKHFQVYFFYAHAEANWDDPWQSYIHFPLKLLRQYGKLTYTDIDAMDWRGADLVILAGCETAGNRFYSGAGLSGLQRSFLGAGARQVLATFWKVDAGQVTLQMKDFLEVWNHSGDAALALQKMQQTAIARLKRDPYLNYPHPLYWGAYNLIGTKPSAPVSSVYAGRMEQ